MAWLKCQQETCDHWRQRQDHEVDTDVDNVQSLQAWCCHPTKIDFAVVIRVKTWRTIQLQVDGVVKIDQNETDGLGEQVTVMLLVADKVDGQRVKGEWRRENQPSERDEQQHPGQSALAWLLRTARVTLHNWHHLTTTRNWPSSHPSRSSENSVEFEMTTLMTTLLTNTSPHDDAEPTVVSQPYGSARS